MKIKRIIALLLCCCLCAAAAAPAHAVAVVDDLVIWGVAAVLGAWGITFAAADATKGEVADTLSDLLERAGVVTSTIATGAAAISAPGILKLQPSVINAARKVALYLKEQVGSITGSHTIVAPVDAYQMTGKDGIVRVSSAAFDGWAYNGYGTVLPADGFTFRYGDVGDYRDDLGNGLVLNGSDYIWWYNGGRNRVSWGMSTDIRRFYGLYLDTHGVQTGSTEPYCIVHLADYGSGTVYASGKAYLPSSKDVFLHVQSGASVSAALDDAAIPDDDTETPVYTGAPGIDFTTPAGAGDAYYNGMTGEAAYPQTATYPTQYEAENARDEAVPVVVPVGVADDYTVTGLASVFPFCIPFDLYDMYAALRANREAPAVSWRMYVPGLVDYTFDIDLSPYDSAAQVLRTMELLAFCVGLALATKKLLGW